MCCRPRKTPNPGLCRDPDDRPRHHGDGHARDQGGAFDYIAKPFELDQLLETLKRAESTADEEPTTMRRSNTKICQRPR